MSFVNSPFKFLCEALDEEPSHYFGSGPKVGHVACSTYLTSSSDSLVVVAVTTPSVFSLT